MEYGPVRKFIGDAVSDPDTIRELEASNLPAVLISGVGNWPAISRWDPAKGGLHHLKSLAGSKMVQSITSNSGSAFYGHIRGHDRVAVSFGGFIDWIISGVTGYDPRSPVGTEENDGVSPVSGMPIDNVEADAENRTGEGEQGLEHRALDGHLYLAQVPIFSKEAVQETTLSPLMQDIEMPRLLETDRVSDINLWMSMTDSRSSTHYDPYQNLLCVVAGEKKVTLWPPSAAPFLYPLPINGEASNHSGVDFVQPDYKAHPLFHKALSVAQLITLHPGDALFIPEGWYHQVDNFGVTIAVNFWWPSKMSLALGTHMDAYFLRRILVNLVDQEKDRMLGKDLFQHIKQRQPLPETNAVNSISGPVFKDDDGGEIFLHTLDDSQDTNSNNVNSETSTESMTTPQSDNKPPNQVMKLEDLTAMETFNLNCLVESLSRNAGTQPVVSETSHSGSQLDHGREISTHRNSSYSSEVQQDNSTEISREGVSGQPKTDSIARVFSALTALSLRRILLVMANHFPRMLETLVLTRLSPSAAEILTRKFEELDASTEASSQAAFYEQFYRAFESSDAVMEALLNGKEAFSAQALRNVLSQFLSIDLSGSSFFS
ncbi:unnamed protein product [Calypogeia fissa]